MTTKAQMAITIESLRAELDTLRLIAAQDATRLAAARLALSKVERRESTDVPVSSWKAGVDARRAAMAKAKAIAMASNKTIRVQS